MRDSLNVSGHSSLYCIVSASGEITRW